MTQDIIENRVSLVQAKAPNFKAIAVLGNDLEEIELSQYKGRWVCLFFYPLNFTFVCPTEIMAFSDRMDEFKQINCKVLGCSVDSHFSHLTWINTPRDEGGIGGLKYPLLSDVGGKIAMDYGVYLSDEKVALRGLFLINPNQEVVYQVVNGFLVGRSVEETLRVLKAFQLVDKKGGFCPANWQEGQKTMKLDSKKLLKAF